MRARSLSHLSHRELLRRLAAVLGREREVTAELILCLAEVLRRRLYVAEGYSSMHAYCVGALGLSEDSAGKRIRVVREARRFPQILDMIADGRLHLSAICLLAPHLTRENAAGLFAAAARRSKREIELMLAERFPQPDLAARIQALPPAQGPGAEDSVPGRISAGLAAAPEALSLCVAPQPLTAAGAPGAPSAKSVPGRIPDNSLTASRETAAAPAPSPWPRVAPLAPERYSVQFTMDQAMHDDLRRAQELLGRGAAGEIPEIFRRALRELVTGLEKRKFAVTSKPKQKSAATSKRRQKSVATSKPKAQGPTQAQAPPPLQAQPQSQSQPAPANSRHIPAAVRREVWERDRGRCTFVSANGHCCGSREAIEFDHIEPVARGGRSTLENLRLRCRAHNQYAAEQAFGEGFMHEIRERARAAPVAQCPGP